MGVGVRMSDVMAMKERVWYQGKRVQKLRARNVILRWANEAKLTLCRKVLWPALSIEKFLVDRFPKVVVHKMIIPYLLPTHMIVSENQDDVVAVIEIHDDPVTVIEID